MCEDSTVGDSDDNYDPDNHGIVTSAGIRSQGYIYMGPQSTEGCSLGGHLSVDATLAFQKGKARVKHQPC